MSRLLRIFGFLCACGALLAAYLLISTTEIYAEARTIGADVSDFEELSDRFVALADTKGAEYAFEVLLRAELPPNTDIHLLGHVVGDELYLQEGVDGIATCTQEFRNACSHSIVIGALNEFGDEALTLIREACVRAPGGSGAYTMCFHGLGHGVFAYFQYSLPETIEFCRSTGTEAYRDQEYMECVGGAIMELMGGGGHDKVSWEAARERYLQRPLSPCVDDVIPTNAKGVCFTYLTPRLFELAGADLGDPDPSLFRKAFLYCEAIPETYTLARHTCFGGFGKEFIVLAGGRDIRDVSNYEDSTFRTAIDWCGMAGSLKGEESCIESEIASIFWGGENDPDAAIRFCQLVPEEIQATCYTRLSDDIASFLRTSSERGALCARLPEEYSARCAR